MKKLIIPTAILAITLGACSQAEAPAVNAPTVPMVTDTAQNIVGTKTKAVLVHADWCGSCKVLDPNIQKVKAMGSLPGLEFVTLDYTAKDESAFYAQADAAGVGEALRDYLAGRVSTGQLVLVDMDDQTVRGTVTKADEPAQILTALKDAIAAS